MTRLLGVLAFALAAALGPLAAAPAAATEVRTVTASARCIEADGDDPARVEAIIENQSGLPITLSYVHGFTTGRALSPRFLQTDPGPQPVYTIEHNDRMIVYAGWDDLRRSAGDVGGAVVVTSGGVLLPLCGERTEAQLTEPLPRLPRTSREAEEQAATLAMLAIGWLEGWHAYPALYAIMHPDAQAEVPFEAMACWYVDTYGLPGRANDKTVFRTDVTEVAFGDWEWAVNGETYLAAAVSYRQEVGTAAEQEEIEGTAHLVEEDGQYRWFFGISRASLDAQRTDCDLGS
jgi:hypothetical protein